MTTAEAFSQLDQWAAQIVHGKNLFQEVRDSLQKEIVRLEKLVDELEDQIVNGEEE